MNDRQVSSWRETYRALQSEGSNRCSDEVILATLAVGELESPVREQLVNHLVACRKCSERYRCLVQPDEANGCQARD